MADVFISYNQADRDLVRLTAAFLEASGFSVWWDTSLLAGDDFQLKILDEVAKARAVIVIWTPNSVKSTWVRSEAGRAQSDHKLLPLKAAGVTYDEIPPPFNLLHTEDASNRDAVLLSVKAQMGKPAPAPVLVKKARYEVLSWIGVIGATITLTANLRGTMQLAQYVRTAVEHWDAIVTSIWRTLLFFLPTLSTVDALLLSVFSFTLVALFSSRSSADESAHQKAFDIPFFPPVILAAIFTAGMSQSSAPGSTNSLLAIELALLTWLEYLQISPALRAAIVVVIFYYPPFWISMWIWSRTHGARLHYTNYVTIPLGTALVVAQSTRWLFGTGEYGYTVIIVMWISSIAVIIYLAASFAVGISISNARLSLRLWRIVAGVALLTAVNYGMLWLEKQPWAAEVLK